MYIHSGSIVANQCPLCKLGIFSRFYTEEVPLCYILNSQKLVDLVIISLRVIHYAAMGHCKHTHTHTVHNYHNSSKLGKSHGHDG